VLTSCITAASDGWKYDFVLAPESDPDRIELRFAGAKGLRVDQDGNLVVQMAGGQVIEHTPVIYQQIGGMQRPVAGVHVLKSKDKVGFKLASYDQSRLPRRASGD